jgi:hypothetical protein
MLGTLVLAASLSLAPHQGGQLKLTNPHATYGYLGPTRSDDKVLPGDFYWVAFDIEGLSVKEDGTVQYSMGMELLNAQGKTEFKKDPQDLESNNSLGGDRMPGVMNAEIGTDTAPGKYTMKVTVTDRRAKKTETLAREFEVLPKDFGLVRLQLTTVANNPEPVPPVAVAGQSILLNCFAINFNRDKTSEQPNVGVQITILDDKGNKTLAKPFSDEVTKDVPKSMIAIPISLPLHLNRSGKYTVVVEATDRLGKKDPVKLSFPLQVLEQR